MRHYIFKQLEFVRNNTICHIADMDDEASLFIPEGYNNHIKWNLGHIYVVQEKFAFYFIGEKMIMPDNYMELFGAGTKPVEWGEQDLPSIHELIRLLDNQTLRIQQVLELRMEEEIGQPYTTSTGLTLSTVEELLSFCLYHEGMHFATIKSIKRMSDSKGNPKP